ncbi:uncharacterized protein METZ01_LOCUS491568 [marine metagenome]|uniref:Uncharacterized protein n=1 Tax=marine metagenome TaxID=408172 RepID=A0A383D324_9ZZZZ
MKTIELLELFQGVFESDRTSSI